MGFPRVSVVIPCYNEEKTIRMLLEAIYSQSMPVGSIEVLISDGLSSDRTREEINDFQLAHPDLSIQVLDNYKRTIPAALNQAIQNATGENITRMDAHAIPAQDYIEKSLQALEAGLGENVGGVIDVKPGRDNWIGRSISIATAHPLGVGDARYRWTTKATAADTVAFGTYRKSLYEKIGGYDEKLLVNEDYEFNTRIRKTGGRIWIDPAIRAIYYSRPDLSTLAKQYFNYGFWKYRMLRRYPETLRWRQALPPLFVTGILMLLLLSIFWSVARVVLAAVAALYLLVLMVGSVGAARKKGEPLLVFGIPLAIMTMHFSWGSGFLWSMGRSVFTGKQHGD
jgi:glycosyltransferase involved in cell wall biosynthesis